MGIVHQHDKRSGITYAYESQSYWDKELGQSRAKRKLIGRVDDETGEIVPTDGRGRKVRAVEGEGVDGTHLDYKALFEAEVAKGESQRVLIESLQNQIKQLKG